MLFITIKQKNAAFERDAEAETARILRHLADQCDDGCVACTIKDVNGNSVGVMRTVDD